MHDHDKGDISNVINKGTFLMSVDKTDDFDLTSPLIGRILVRAFEVKKEIPVYGCASDSWLKTCETKKGDL